MLFIEKRGFIKPENTKYTSYIADFNVAYGKERSFFLETDLWDEFTKYMAKERPDILLELEYEPLKDEV